MKTVNIREVALAEIIDLPVHPIADIFPMLSESTSDRDSGKADKQTLTLGELADSITENGLQEPIVLFNDEFGKLWLLDGRNRRAACVLGKIETVLVEDFVGTEEDAETYVLNLNIDRRDLTPGQRAFAAAKYWEMEAERAKARQGQGGRFGSNLIQADGESGRTREVLASRFRVSNSYVTQAHKELDAINAARLKAEELQRKAEELEVVEKEAVAKIELAKASGDMDTVREVVVELQQASTAKTDLRERAAVAAETASTRERKANRVQKGESFNSVYGEKKQETVSDDPVAKLRTRVNSTFANLKQAVSELAEVTSQGEEDYNYIGRRVSEFIDHFEKEFGVGTN